MKPNYLQLALGVLIGIGICLLTGIGRCKVNTIKTSPIVKVKTDTFFKDSVITKFKPKIVYRDRLEIIRQIDSVDRFRYITRLDSFFIDTSNTKIPVNSYQGTISERNVTLDYDIETAGFLTKFKPVITFRELPCRPDKNWIFAVGLSDKVNWKTGIGYKGWLAEIEFDRKTHFNQLYITKQFKF